MIVFGGRVGHRCATSGTRDRENIMHRPSRGMNGPGSSETGVDGVHEMKERSEWTRRVQIDINRI